MFLESEFETDGRTDWSYKLKNENATAKDKHGEYINKVWRYHHNDSGLPFEIKKATIFSILRKVHHMASDNNMLFTSAYGKLKEFERLRYTRSLRKFVCAIMARDYNSTIWRYIRSIQS